jgi:hypothetical protein
VARGSLIRRRGEGVIIGFLWTLCSAFLMGFNVGCGVRNLDEKLLGWFFFEIAGLLGASSFHSKGLAKKYYLRVQRS